ncbi:MAG: hypothetical protein OXG07_07400 [Anaerolineaceae bacterium]|nr:hypothetical protein [Anaerolineaceae bacterium]
MSQPQTATTETLPPEWQNLATKADLAEIHGDLAELRGVTTELRSDVVELRSRMAYMATKEDLVELRTRLDFMATREDMAQLRGEFAGLRAEFAGLRSSLRTAGWFAGLVVGLLAVVAQVALFFLQRSLG